MEIACWMVGLALAALSSGIAGVVGFTEVLEPTAMRDIFLEVEGTTFDVRQAVLALLLVFVLTAAGVFLPHRVLGGLAPPARRTVLGVTSVATAVAALALFFFPVVWLSWLVALLLGVAVAVMVLQSPDANQKPWRTAGVAAGLLLFVTYAFQIVGGVEAGALGVRWFLLLGAVLLLVAAVLVLLGPAQPQAPPETGTFPQASAALRAPEEIARPWACHLLFGVLGAVFALAQPAVIDEGFGQAGFAVIVCSALLGWAIGYEVGPTFAPGMTRPRLTSFALLGSGVLMGAAGIIEELSGKAVLSGAVAFAVGVGVRAQPYVFSRRVGVTLGGVLALLLASAGFRAEVPLSTYAHWSVSSIGIGYGAVGLAALIAGVVALFTFSPQGLQGLAVDVVHAFRSPAAVPEGHSRGLPSGGALGPAGDHAAATGVFVAFEGADGSGKSTQASLLAEHLRSRGLGPVTVTREPGGTEAGRAMRSVLLDGEGVAARSEALLFAADRAHHVAALVGPALERGEVVITDRYIDSSLSYQAAGRELPRDEIAQLSRWATEGLVPHLTIVLDIDPQTAAARTASRGEQNHLDSADIEFRRRVRESFLDLAAKEPSRYIVIDADRTAAQIAADVHAAVDRLLSTRAAPQVRPDQARSAPVPPGVPGSAVPADHSGEAVTTVLDRGGAAQSAHPPADRSTPDRSTPDRSSATPHPAPATPNLAQAPKQTGPVLPTDQGEAATTVIPTRGSESAAVRPDEEPTTVLPGRPAAEEPQFRQTKSRERLQAQAEIERRARERLRQARMRSSGRERPQNSGPQNSGPQGPGPQEPGSQEPGPRDDGPGRRR